MYVGSELIKIYLPGIRSLKEKRKYLNSIKDRIRKQLKLAVSEVGLNDAHQHSELGICGVGKEKKSVRELFEKIEYLLKKYPELEFNRGGVEIEKKQKNT